MIFFHAFSCLLFRMFSFRKQPFQPITLLVALWKQFHVESKFPGPIKIIVCLWNQNSPWGSIYPVSEPSNQNNSSMRRICLPFLEKSGKKRMIWKSLARPQTIPFVGTLPTLLYMYWQVTLKVNLSCRTCLRCLCRTLYCPEHFWIKRQLCLSRSSSPRTKLLTLMWICPVTGCSQETGGPVWN